MDAVVNLRAIYAVLKQEQSDTGQKNLIGGPWKLEYARAADVKLQLEQLLGLESKPAGPMSRDQMRASQQMEMMRMQMQQQQAQQAQKTGGAAVKDPAVTAEATAVKILEAQRAGTLKAPAATAAAPAEDKGKQHLANLAGDEAQLKAPAGQHNAEAGGDAAQIKAMVDRFATRRAAAGR